MFLDIVEVVKKTGIPASTLRYYEEKGLIASVGRHGLKRQFDSAIVQRLALISLGVQAGFSLDEIAAMLPEDAAPQIDRELLLAKADELDATLARIAALRDALRHTATCPAPNHLECPTFQKMLAAASSSRARQRRPKRGLKPAG